MSEDLSLLSTKTIDAYLEMIVGIICLRIPQVQDFLIPNYPKATVKSSYDMENLIINTPQLLNDFKTEGLKEVKSLQNSLRQVNRIFLLAMWDILIEFPQYQKICNEPIVQFFRHVRNGCAHGNQLNFSTISKPAKWRDKEIVCSNTGMKVFPDLLKDGDPILMLVDVNNAYFKPINFSVGENIT